MSPKASVSREARTYTRNYYDTNVVSAAAESASEVIPFLIQHLSPASVLELGSGTGSWSRVALDGGISDVVAIDGDWVRAKDLRIPPAHFRAHDLTTPVRLSRKFDLAFSLEVGEHLKEEHADVLIDSLVSHSDNVLFGASFPFQGGTLHINEQWPTFWRAKFASRGYTAVDIIRPLFWNNSKVAYYYKQNTFLYCRNGADEALVARLNGLVQAAYQSSPDLIFIHPSKYAELASFESVNVKRMLRKAPGLVARALLQRLSRFGRE